MTATDSAFQNSPADLIRHEIRELLEWKTRALQMAVYVGMTTAEAQEFDNCTTKLSDLLRRLMALKKNDQP
ncbi:MAG TPA: hypothetical protein VMU05_14855 [Dongiaceae bacterium]|nr:hypothetical protein [Dongiaceae bacterium]